MEEILLKIEELEGKVSRLEADNEALQKRVNDYENSSLMPYRLEQSIKERIKPISANSVTTEQQKADLVLTGEAETVEVAPLPSGVLTVRFNENTYDLFYK